MISFKEHNLEILTLIIKKSSLRTAVTFEEFY